MSIQQILLGSGVPIELAKYVDEVFSTYLYDGNGADKTITNGIDLAGKGGLTWIKNRSSAKNHALVDTVRGASQYLSSNSNAANAATGANNNFNSFTSTGFTLKNDNGNDIFNNENSTYASWSFRKAKGFFDIQEYSSSSSNTSGSIGNPNFQVNHDLGCVPGMILIKRTDGTNDWFAWVRGKEGVLNSSGTLFASGALPLANVTSTYFKFAQGNGSYNDPYNYIAYIFAGGESPEADAVSVSFDGADDYLSISDDDDWIRGTLNFTIEAWVKIDETNAIGEGFVSQWPAGSGERGWYFGTVTENSLSNNFCFRWSTSGSNGPGIYSDHQVKADGQFHHYAVSKHSGTIRLFVDGLVVASQSMSANIYNSNGAVVIGHNLEGGSGWFLHGKISNVRITKGGAWYPGDFIVPDKPLTNIWQTKLLCCQSSTVTAATVIPTGSISANGSPTSSTESPFDDPASFIFGTKTVKEGLIKCGMYRGNGNSDGPVVNIGWEPQWVLIKWADGSENWVLCDSTRKIASGDLGTEGSAPYIIPSNSSNESKDDPIELTATGFKISDSYNYVNNNGTNYIYVAIRRTDTVVGTPSEAATDVFTMVTGTGSSASDDPSFSSGFLSDMGLYRAPASQSTWHLGTRLTGSRTVSTNSSGAQSNSSVQWDHNTKFGPEEYGSSYQAWIWKRCSGFATVVYTGDGSSDREIWHDLGSEPRMMWIKHREKGSGADARNWVVYHRGLNNGGTTNQYGTPGHYYVPLNHDFAEINDDTIFNDTMPESDHFTVGSNSLVNENNSRYVAMLFADVAGVSKCGWYGGANVTLTNTLVGFQPRFLMIKRISGADNGRWHVFDTLRGLGTTSVNGLYLDGTDSQAGHGNIISLLSNGFTITNNNQWNAAGEKYIYYAHA